MQKTAIAALIVVAALLVTAVFMLGPSRSPDGGDMDAKTAMTGVNSGEVDKSDPDSRDSDGRKTDSGDSDSGDSGSGNADSRDSDGRETDSGNPDSRGLGSGKAGNGGAGIDGKTPGDSGTEDADAAEATLITDMLAVIDRQSAVDEMLLSKLRSGAYVFDSPLVTVDPYGLSPLTALALFVTDKPTRISVHVPGKTRQAEVDFTFSGYNTNHIIPIYGLYPGQVNKVEITGEIRNGQAESITLDIQTEQLPPELMKNIILTDLIRQGNYQPGLNFTSAQKSAFDIGGEYRWFYKDSLLGASTLYNYNGNMIFTKGAFYEGGALIFESNMLGKIISVYYSPYGVHHDIADIDGRNLLLGGNRGNTIEDIIYEIDVESGEITNLLDLKFVLQRTRAEGSPEYSATDWFHNNSVEYYDGSIIVSGRHQSAVAKLAWPGGEVEWILSDHIGWNKMLQKFLLTQSGNDFEWPYGQQAPVILPDYSDDPDEIDILLFDNGNGRFYNDKELRRAIANNETVEPEPYSRMVHYQINEANKTVRQIWQFGKELGEAYYTEGLSSAVMLDNNNRLGTFDIYHAGNEGNSSASIVEVDSRGDVVWEAYGTCADDSGSMYVYRCLRLPIYNDAANNLHIGAPARNFIPQDMRP